MAVTGSFFTCAFIRLPTSSLMAVMFAPVSTRKAKKLFHCSYGTCLLFLLVESVYGFYDIFFCSLSQVCTSGVAVCFVLLGCCLMWMDSVALCVLA